MRRASLPRILLLLLATIPARLFAWTAEEAASGIFKSLNFGHMQHSGLNTGSFGVFRTDYDDYTSPFYYEAAFTDNLKDRSCTAPVLKSGTDENYWNLGANMQYEDIFASLVYYNAISSFQDWPANMTDLGLAATFAYGKRFSVQARYYDFCVSGGIGMIMPGLTLAAAFGEGDYKARLSLGTDLCIWYLGPWGNDKFLPRIETSFDFSRDSMRGAGLAYRIVPPIDGTKSKVDKSGVAVSHTLSFWAGAAKDLGRYTLAVRPYGCLSLNAVNPTDVRYWELLEDDGALGPDEKEENWYLPHRLGEYNLYAGDGNMEFLARLPIALSFRVSQQLTVTGATLFGLYYANFDHYGYTGLGGDNGTGWVPEVGASLGLQLKMGGASLAVGSSFIRAPSLDRSKYADRERFYNQFWRHSYYAEDLSLANMASAPLSLSLSVSF